MHQCNFFHPACSAPKESTFSLATFLDFFQPHFSSLKQTGKQNTDLHSTVSPSDPWWEWSAFSAGFVVEVHRTLSCVSVFDIWQMATCSSLQSSPKCLHMISSFSGICWLSHGGGGRTVLLHQVLMIVLHYCQSCLFSIYSHESFFFFLRKSVLVSHQSLHESERICEYLWEFSEADKSLSWAKAGVKRLGWLTAVNRVGKWTTNKR